MTAGRGGRLAGAVGSWWAALRIARREARRARGRTALVLAMITLPVLALTFTAVSWDMSKLTRAERTERRLGVADAELLWVARGPIAQDAWGEGWMSGEPTVEAGQVTAEQVAALLPAGSRVVPLRRWVSFDARVGDRVERDVPGRAVDLADPLGRGLARFHSGRAPAGPDEIAVSPAALRRLDVRPGGTLTSGDGSRSWRVVGVVEYPDDLGPVVTLHPATAVPAGAEPHPTWLVDLPGTVDEALFRRLNDHGVLVHARAPAPPSEVDVVGPDAFGPVDVEGMSVSVLVGGLGLLEVVLLVGPAFAVGVRRRRRDLALVAVAGGDDAHLRRIVLADGVVLGALGAATGLALGVAAAFAARPLVEQHLYGVRFGGYRCWPEALVAIAAVAVLAGVLAALAPAWA
ncbi:FtsX-like permease family protein, partial [Micromonospora sp. NPDC000018]